MKKQWIFKEVIKILPERREIKPIGRITLFGKTLSAEETKNYVRTLGVKEK